MKLRSNTGKNKPPCGSDGKESAHNAGDLGSVLGWEDPLEKGKATYTSIIVRLTP